LWNKKASKQASKNTYKKLPRRARRFHEQKEEAK
jgi:hypothetical protein